MKLDETYQLLFLRLRNLASRRGAHDPESCASEAISRFLDKYCVDKNDLSAVLESAEQRLSVLMLILRNVVYEGYRKKRREVGNDLAMDTAADASDSPMDQILDQEQKRCVKMCIQKLEGRHRTVILLRRRGLAYKRIAEELGVKVTDVTNWLNRATDRLRECVNGCCNGLSQAS